MHLPFFYGWIVVAVAFVTMAIGVIPVGVLAMAAGLALALS